MEMATTYPEYEMSFEISVPEETIDKEIMKNTDHKMEDVKTEYDISVFMKMMAQKKRLIPTVPGRILFY